MALKEQSEISAIQVNDLPDPTIKINQKNEYGYTNNELLPLNIEKALELFDNDYTIFMRYKDNTELMIFDHDEIFTNKADNSDISETSAFSVNEKEVESDNQISPLGLSNSVEKAKAKKSSNSR